MREQRRPRPARSNSSAAALRVSASNSPDAAAVRVEDVSDAQEWDCGWESAIENGTRQRTARVKVSGDERTLRDAASYGTY